MQALIRKRYPGLGCVFLAAALALSFKTSAAELSGGKTKPPRIAPASSEAELAIKRFKIPPGFKVELFAAEPFFAHPVAFCVDEKNRFYVAESFRVGVQVTDIRGHMNWLDEELASTNTAQWRQIIEKYLKSDFMTAETERLTRLEDTDADGKADKSIVIAEGFNDLQSGIAAGVLARKGDIWFTCIPDLWHLRDTQGEGQASAREILHHGFGVRFGFYGHDLHGLRIGPDGKLYFSIGDRGFNVLTKEGKRVAAPEMGAVLRCNRDGSDLEIFATGLRNPQELAFDQYGNLFTGDNNSDGGDQARWVYVVEGGDSGWRIGYQFLTWPMPRGPWNAEKMWHPQNAEQPAFLVPPLANLADGPSGLAYNPGQGLPAEYDGHFLIADFRGSPASSLIHSFALKPRGASFEVIDRKPFISQILATDVDFGMDGAIYISDWVEGWGKTGKGRLYRMYDPHCRTNVLVGKTRELMAEGFERRTDRELAAFLAWPDQRVRQEAQFELAARGPASIRLLSELARKNTHQLARLHAIWGLGQIHAQMRKQGLRSASAAVRPLLALLKDSDAEVRAQAAKVLGDARYSEARRALSQLVTDSRTPRVQFFASMALGKIGGKQGLNSILEMLRENSDRDPYLRHAGVMALTRIGDLEALERAGQDKAPSVRLAALLAFRRLGNPSAARFLHDSDQRIALEAARAIYDLPIDSAMSKLAALIHEPLQSEPLLRRVINANFRLGHGEAAAALAGFAANNSAPDTVRIEALQALGSWEKPSGRDRVTGLWRPLGERAAGIAADAFRPVAAQLLGSASDEIRVEAAILAGHYQTRDASKALTQIVKSETAGSRARSEALRALAAMNDPAVPELIESSETTADEELRKAASALLVKLNPSAGSERLARKLKTGTIGEKQAAFLALGSIENESANQILAQWMDQLLAGKVDGAIQLDLLEGAGRHKAAGIKIKIEQFDSSRPRNEIGKYVECLSGGNAAEGRKIFFERAEASCVRCHKIGGQGGEAGPELDKANTNRTREYILESIVAPNKTIAPGFENQIVKLKNGVTYAGLVKSETATELTLNTPEDGLVTVAQKEIESRGRGGSGMPEGLGDLLSKRDLRNLVEFLATLK